MIVLVDLFNDLHDDDVLIDLGNGVPEERGELVLVRGNLTVSGGVVRF